MKFSKQLMLLLKGLFMGAADVIPGVSGGTVALITGIYPKLIKSLNEVNFFPQLVKGKFRETWKIIRKVDYAFFIPLVLGILMAVFLLSKTISYALETYPARTYALFFGLIIASALVMYKHLAGISINKAILAVVGFITAYWIVGIANINIQPNQVTIFFAGMIAICAMILPGISGSLILLISNHYEYLVNAQHTLNFSIIITFSVGAIIGLLTFSKLLNKLLDKHFATTVSFLLGLMLGSLRLPIIIIQESRSFIDPSVIFWLLVGIGVTLLLEYLHKIKMD